MNSQLIPTPAPRIAHFENLAYGLFVHWGLYSQLERGEWIQHVDQIPGDQYAALIHGFTAQDFDARELARFARAAGMKYIVLTTRHHEGFSLYDTRGLDDFDAPHSPAQRDLVAEFVEGCRAEGIAPFFYHTTIDWRPQWDTRTRSAEQFGQYLDYLHESVEILCTQYGEIGGLWFDGNWARRDVDWQEDRLYSMIRRHQPDAMIINNTSLESYGTVGHAELDAVTFEQGMPIAPDRSGWPKYLAGEMCQTMNEYWGISRSDWDFLSPREVLEQLCACRKVGANFLLNIGPTAMGAIPAYEKAALLHVGRWIEKFGPSLYDGKPTNIGCQGRDFVLQSGDNLYYFALDLARNNPSPNHQGTIGPRALAGLQTPIESVRWLDNNQPAMWTQNAGNGLAAIEVSKLQHGTNPLVRVAQITLDLDQ